MITVNVKNVELPHPMSVAEYLEANQYSAGRIAVELNHKILSKAYFADTMLTECDTLEIVTFVGGG